MHWFNAAWERELRVDYESDAEVVGLRGELREVITEWFGDHFAGIFVDDPGQVERTREFCAELGRRQLLTAAWPVEHGGRALSVWSQTVVKEEMWAHNEPRGPQYMNLNWVGPAIMRFGTDSQIRAHLPPIAAGAVIWCQGFSEPDAGSDLASLRLDARRNGQGWTLNGQKIWTSYADIADWCVLAGRTDAKGPKQHGITLFLIPMDRSGVEVRPIDSMLGPHHFNEVFFSDVEVHEAEVLGEVDKGWEVMTSALAFERAGIARYARSAKILADLCRAVADGEVCGAVDSRRIARAAVHVRIAQLLYYRVLAESSTGQPPGALASSSRILNTTLEQEVASVAMDTIGAPALFGHDASRTVSGGNYEHHWRYAQAATVAAGTLEVQKMLVARALLA